MNELSDLVTTLNAELIMTRLERDGWKDQYEINKTLIEVKNQGIIGLVNEIESFKNKLLQVETERDELNAEVVAAENERDDLRAELERATRVIEAVRAWNKSHRGLWESLQVENAFDEWEGGQ